MKTMLVGAVALSLLGVTAASAQPYQQQDRNGVYHDRGGDRSGHNRGDHYDNRDRRGGHWRGHRHYSTVCAYRHHRRVCWQQQRW